MQQIEIWFEILFLSRKKFPAKQTLVLSSSMKLGPDLLMLGNISYFKNIDKNDNKSMLMSLLVIFYLTVPGAAPSGLTVKPINDQPDSLTLLWEPLPLNNINGDLQGYLIGYCQSESSCTGKG